MSSISSSTTSISDLFRPTKPKGLNTRNLSTTRLNLLKKEIQTDLHLKTLQELYGILQTDPVRGLSTNRADDLLEHYGPNALTPSSKNGLLIVLFKSLCTGFSVLMWFGAVLCIIAYMIESSTKPNPNLDNLYLGFVLIGVDIICGLFSFYQNYKSSKIMASFNNMIPSYAKCIRDGVMNFETPVNSLVRGDIVRVVAGDIVPADIRVIESKGFKVDNSSITGESIAVSRCNTEGTWNILESPNVAFFSTQCVEGWAIGVVLCTGDVTALGRVAGLAARLEPGPSPLACELNRFMRYMSFWALGLGIFIALSSLILGYPFMQTTIFVIGIIVANIPEGLQPTVTAALTITAQHMMKKNCLVKNLQAVEALGACTTICSDKTGTLTENKMNVQHLWVSNMTILVKEFDFTAALQNNRAFAALKLCGSLCSTASIETDGRIRGDASESAILNFLFKVDDPMSNRTKYPKVAEIPFNSVNKYQVSVHLDSATSQYIVVMKGAPECLFERCATIAMAGRDEPMTKDMKSQAERASEGLADTGERVLAFADLILDPKKYPLNYEFDADNVNFPIENLRFIGVMGLMDPPRAEVRRAIERVREAGVRVMMVTGDHPATARAIALEVGIATNPKCFIVTGNELRKLTSDLLIWTLQKHNEIGTHGYRYYDVFALKIMLGDHRFEIVFARTSPTQKLQIVEACQRQGQVVAVTGDGVNDAPALRQADIGISMGITGSQVSKHTADIILMDDNFATIVTGIEEGRKIFDNLKKSLCYILISNVPEIGPVLMFILFAIPLPLGVMTILCIDLGTDMWPAIALSYEHAETDVMARPPRSQHTLISGRALRLVYGHLGLIEFAAGMYAYFVVMAEHGFYPSDLFGKIATQHTADIILMDDNFATIVTGIEEGRKIFDNLKKSLCYILISNVPEIGPVLMFILFAIPLPLGVMTILCIDLGTDMWPAIALSYEHAETDVMARPPRSQHTLISGRALRLVYGHLGLIEFAAGMYAYFVVMAEHGFYPSDLFGIRHNWDNEAISDLADSLGQEWTFAERKMLERASQTTYFVAVVITQICNGIICKTRYNSLFHVGMKNNVLNSGLVFELLIACVVCYAPGFSSFFRTYPLRLHWWFLALPFCVLMFIFDEFRKYCIRNKLFNEFYNNLTYY